MPLQRQAMIWSSLPVGHLNPSDQRHACKRGRRMDQRIIALYDEFTHRHLDRRLFLEQATKLAGSAAAALAALSLLQSNRALGQIVAPSDRRLTTTAVSFPGSTSPVKGYLARPSGDAKLPGVVVIHENRGLVPHIQDVAR